MERKKESVATAHVKEIQWSRQAKGRNPLRELRSPEYLQENSLIIINRFPVLVQNAPIDSDRGEKPLWVFKLIFKGNLKSSHIN